MEKRTKQIGVRITEKTAQDLAALALLHDWTMAHTANRILEKYTEKELAASKQKAGTQGPGSPESVVKS